MHLVPLHRSNVHAVRRRGIAAGFVAAVILATNADWIDAGAHPSPPAAGDWALDPDFQPTH